MATGRPASRASLENLLNLVLIVSYTAYKQRGSAVRAAWFSA